MSAPRPLVIGNWKMNLDFVEALHLVQQLGVMLKSHPVEHTDAVVAPPFVDLRSVTSVVEADRLNLAVGAQHVNWRENGAHTGEVSLAMLTRLNVRWVIVGHSERRQHYGMDDETVERTVGSVTRAGLRAVLCVGESLEVREAGEHEAFVEAQLRSALAGLEVGLRENVTIAYEPLWAIGTGVNAQPEQVQAMNAHIKAVLQGLKVPATGVLYGGSVNPDNAAALMRDGGAGGFLVGGASLKAESFYAILRACDDCYAVKR